MAGILVLAWVLSVGLFQAPAFAGTTYVDGVSDQSLTHWSQSFSEFFTNTWVNNGHIKYARFFFQWNGMSKGEESSVKESFESAARMGLGIDLSLTVYPGDSFPSRSEYLTALHGFLGLAQSMHDPITYVEPWNEPNAQGELKNSPAVAAEYTAAAHTACEEYGCTIIAGNFFDSTGMASYEREMISSLKADTSWKPSVWGIHPYEAVEKRKPTSIEQFKKVLSEDKESTQIVFSEVGAFHCTSKSEYLSEEEEMLDAYYLINNLIPDFTPLHVFYYEFDYKNNEPPPCGGGGADTSLFLPSGESEQIFKPREGAALIRSNKFEPWAFTTGPSSVTSTSANLSGVAYPVGMINHEAEELFSSEAYFQYGLTTGYGQSTATETVPASPAGLAAHHASTSISNLEPGKTYHYRLVAFNSEGTSYGEDKTFRTFHGATPAVAHEGGEWWVYFQGSEGDLRDWFYNGSSWGEWNIGGQMWH